MRVYDVVCVRPPAIGISFHSAPLGAKAFHCQHLIAAWNFAFPGSCCNGFRVTTSPEEGVSLCAFWEESRCLG